jgi:hypothetical protein
LFLLFGGWVYGQDVRASLGGIVTDSNGASIAHATVAVTADETGVIETTETNTAGEWLVSTLLPGFYHFEVKAPGFKDEKRTSIELQLGDKKLIDTQMQIGLATQTVTVEATTPLIDMTSAASGSVVTQAELEEIPTQSNAPTMQVAILPGTTVSGGVGGGVFLWSNSGLSETTINGVGYSGGAGIGAISYSLDGGTDNFNSGSLAFEPPTDAVNELRMVSNGYDAAIGRGSGANEIISLKSGAERFHGDLYEDNQNDFLNANSYFNDANGTKISPIRVNFYGGSGGGPVWIPKLYDGRRKKTFFYFSWSGIRNLQASDTGYATLPTMQERNGDFSSSYTVSSGKYYPVQIFNPYSTTTGTRDPYAFAGCVMGNPTNPGYSGTGASPPANYTSTCESLPSVDAIAAKYLALIPPPDAPADTAVGNGANNWIKQGEQDDKFHGMTLRVDQTENDRNHTFVDLYYNIFTELSDTDFGTGQYLPLEGQGQYRQNRGITIDHDITLKENLLLDLSYHVLDFNSQLWYTSRNYTAESMGFPASYASQMQRDVIPEITGITANVAGNLGTSEAGRVAPLDLNQDINVRLSQVYKNHNFRYGMEYLIQQEDNNDLGDSGGIFAFGANYSSLHAVGAGSNGTGVGSGIADFELGLPGSSSSIPTNTSSFYSQHYPAFYFQDDWRLNPKLTLNLGLRWDYERPTTERFNRFFSVYNPTVPQPAVTAASQPNYAALVAGSSSNLGVALLQNFGPSAGAFQVMGGPEYAGVGGNSRYMNNPRYKYFQPRIGFAWEVMPNTVLRGGIGRFVGTDFNEGSNQTGFSTSTPFCPSACSNYTIPAQNWESPFSQGLTPITGNSLGILTNVGNPTLTTSVPTYTSPNIGRIYVDTATLGVQRQIKDYLFEVSGLFNAVHGLGMQYNNNSANVAANVDINVPSAAAWLAANTPTFAANWLPDPTLPGATQVTNPFKGVQYMNPTEFGAKTISAYQLLRPNPSAGDIYVNTGIGRDYYYSLNTRVEKRFHDGFGVLQGFNYSKKISEDGLYPNQAVATKIEKRLDTGDNRFHYTLTPIYELPFGRGKQFLGNANRAMDLAVGGWEFSGIYSFLSGNPIAMPTNSAFFSGKDPAVHKGKSITNWFDPTQFAAFPSINTTLATLNDTSVYPAWTGVTSMPGIQYVPGSTPGSTAQNGVYQDFAKWNTYNPTTFGDLRQPYTTNFTLGARKNFLIAEGVRFEFRFDAFNALNHPTFASANTTVGNTYFGQLKNASIANQSNSARQIQIAGRLFF